MAVLRHLLLCHKNHLTEIDDPVNFRTSDSEVRQNLLMKLEIMASDIRIMIIGLSVVISKGKLKFLFNKYLTAFSEIVLIVLVTEIRHQHYCCRDRRGLGLGSEIPTLNVFSRSNCLSFTFANHPYFISLLFILLVNN